MAYRTGASAVVAALSGSVLGAGCADPCFDDGLNQGGCPDAATDTDSGASMTAGVTETMSASMTAATDPDGGSGAETTFASATQGMIECPALDVTLLPSIPTMHLVVDQSGSMDQDFGGITRWDAVVGTLVDPVDGIVTVRQSEIRFGLTLYTGSAAQCPSLTNFAAQLDAADEIGAVFAGAAPADETPTGESLQAVSEFVLADDWDGAKFMVLATDGEPDLCSIEDPTTPEEIDMARSAVVDAVSDAFDQDVRTFVISVGDDVAQGHLQDIANAGVGNGPDDPDATFYTALDQDALVAAFDDIIAGVRECAFELDKPLTTDLAPTCDLTVNGNELGYEDPDGWQLDGELQVELVGAACDAIQQGVVQIEMSCTCEL